MSQSILYSRTKIKKISLANNMSHDYTSNSPLTPTFKQLNKSLNFYRSESPIILVLKNNPALYSSKGNPQRWR